MRRSRHGWSGVTFDFPKEFNRLERWLTGFCSFELDGAQQQGKKTSDRTVVAEQEFVVIVVFWPSQCIDGSRIPFELFSGYPLENDRAQLGILAVGIENDYIPC